MVENEIPFLDWEAFRRMAPSILQLEITRLGTMIGDAGDDLHFRNALVRARFALRQFVACLDATTERAAFEAVCAGHLRTAALHLAADPEELDASMTARLGYVRERIAYLHDRAGFVV